jgi:hypothetical protein
MGKNMMSKVPSEIAEKLSLPNPSKNTFHSFRRTSATSAADAGATTEQLVDFYGWKNASMCQEYISSSKPAIVGMANKLGSMEVEKSDQKQGVVCQQEEPSSFAGWDEDPEMYLNAGIPLVSSTSNSNTDQQGVIESTLKQAMASLPANQGSNLTLKVVVMNNNSGTVNF